MRIEVNLLGGTKKARKGGGGISLPDFAQMFAQVKDPLFIGAIAAVVAAVLFVGFFFTTQQAKLSSLQSEIDDLRAESRRYATLIRQKRQAESLRDSLVVELQAIREIDGDRYIWPHVMEEVTRALPDFSWLVSVVTIPPPPQVIGPDSVAPPPPPVKFEVRGRTSEIAAYTRFLRRMAASPWFTDIVEGPATTVVEDEKAMRAFSVTATFGEADSAFMRTVPVIESVQ